MNKLIFLFLAGVAICGTACNSDRDEVVPSPIPEPPEAAVFADGDTWVPVAPLPAGRAEFGPVDLSESQKALVARQNDFALRLYGEISGGVAGNSVISPVSLNLDLGMLANGACGETLDEMRSILGMEPQMTAGDFNRTNKTLIEGLVSADKTSRISLAGSIWIDNRLEVVKDFVDINCDNYFAGIYRRQLSAVETMDEINSWAEENTEGIINNLLAKPLEDEARMTLANALYFYGSWVDSFDKELTHKAGFLCNSGKSVQADMMVYSKREVEYACSDGCEAVYLPFGNGAYRMSLILPDKDRDIDMFASALTSGMLDRLHAGAGIVENVLMLPKFEVAAETRFRETFDKLGFGRIFGQSADFSGISPARRLFIDDIIQKAVVKVDEEGAEGAAATLVVLDTSAGPDAGPIIFNRPFVFLISEKSTGAILFIGSVKEL